MDEQECKGICMEIDKLPGMIDEPINELFRYLAISFYKTDG